MNHTCSDRFCTTCFERAQTLPVGDPELTPAERDCQAFGHDFPSWTEIHDFLEEDACRSCGVPRRKVSR